MEVIGSLRRNPVLIVRMGVFFHSLLLSISFGPIFDLYLARIAPDSSKANEFVGSVETVRGLTCLLVALPIGFLADNFSKVIILRACTLIGCLAICIFLFSIWGDNADLIYCAVGIFAIYNQCAQGLYRPILFDMVPADKLHSTLSKSVAVFGAGQVFGPLIQILIIFAHGSSEIRPDATVHLLHIIISAGTCIHLFTVVFFWLIPVDKIESEDARALLDHSDAEIPVWHEELYCGIRKRWLIPIAIECMNLCVAIGSGMTFKFWPLFFENDFSLTLTQICVITFFTWISISYCNLVAPRLARWMKNPATTFAWLFFTATTILFIISQAKTMPVVPTAVLVVLRNGIMNCTGPLLDCVILNAVPARHRAKWGSIQSLSRATWAGSAFLGGILSDEHDYRFAFQITAIVHFCSGAFYVCAILPTTRRKEIIGDSGSDANLEMLASGTDDAHSNFELAVPRMRQSP